MNNFLPPDLSSLLAQEGRLKALFATLKKRLHQLDRKFKILEFCGGHTQVIMRNGLDVLLSPWIEFIHGPGCPVCVIAQSRVDYALYLAEREKVILATYGDLIRVPGSSGYSLQDLRAKGRKVKLVDTSLGVLSLAKENPEKRVIFFAIGFETTTPHTAFLAKRVAEEGLKNLFILSNHLRAPTILDHLLSQGLAVDGIIAPGHVSAIIGAKPWRPLAKKHQVPMVISGFEAFDLITSLLLLVDLIVERKPVVEIQYQRIVTEEGNVVSQRLMKEVFEVKETFPWRGFGFVPRSAYTFRETWDFLNAERIYPYEVTEKNPSGCLCGLVLQGKVKPWECKLFGRDCNPQTPIGPCMVSSEGACLVYFKYKAAP